MEQLATQGGWLKLANERAELKESVATELLGAGKRKDSEILELRFMVSELKNKVEVADGEKREAVTAAASAVAGAGALVPAGGWGGGADRAVAKAAVGPGTADWAQKQFEWNQKALKRRM